LTEQELNLLRRPLLLKGLSEPAFAALARAGERRRYGKGQLLFAENQPCIGLIVVLAGAVRIFKMDPRGRELTLGREEPGSSVAELPLFDGGNYPAAAEAAEEDTILYVVPRARFQTLMREHPEIAAAALKALGVRLRKMLKMLEAHSLHTVRARMAAYLVRAAHGQASFALDETNEAIAGQLGTVREVVSRTLRSLREAGVITLHGRKVHILDRPALSRIATSQEE
jgi:CRP/FNR family transcriptional regulator